MRRLWHRIFGQWHWSVRLRRDSVDIKAFHVDLDSPPIARGLISIDGVLYTTTHSSGGTILRQSSDGGSTWTSGSTTTLHDTNYRWDQQDNG